MLLLLLFFCCSLSGYDPGLVNPYLPKVLENLGALVYDEIDNEGQIYFNITAVVSSHGEQLALKQVNAIWFRPKINICPKKHLVFATLQLGCTSHVPSRLSVFYDASVLGTGGISTERRLGASQRLFIAS